MIIIFFGQHSNVWMNVLNNKLINDFSKHTTINIENIKNIYDIKQIIKIIKMDLTTTICIIPLMETHMIELHNNNINALMPSIDNITLFSCKKRFATYVNNNNLGQFTPKVYNSMDEINPNSLYIIKPYNLNNGSNMCIKQQLNKTDFVNKVVQEYIENKIEYNANIVSKNGEIIKCITYAYNFDDKCHIKKYPINTLNMSKFELDYKHIKQLELFLLPCKYTGISNVDFVICDEQIKVFEINPRLGGGLVRFDRHDLVDILSEMINCRDI